MSRCFPLTWAEWKGGVDALYCIREPLEDRLAVGESLSEEEKTWLGFARPPSLTAHW